MKLTDKNLFTKFVITFFGNLRLTEIIDMLIKGSDLLGFIRNIMRMFFSWVKQCREILGI